MRRSVRLFNSKIACPSAKPSPKLIRLILSIPSSPLRALRSGFNPSTLPFFHYSTLPPFLLRFTSIKIDTFLTLSNSPNILPRNSFSRLPLADFDTSSISRGPRSVCRPDRETFMKKHTNRPLPRQIETAAGRHFTSPSAHASMNWHPSMCIFGSFCFPRFHSHQIRGYSRSIALNRAQSRLLKPKK
jgi:hypothetical protein